LRGGGRGLVGERHQRAIDDAALRLARTGAVGDGFQEARGAANGAGAIGIFGNVDIPGAPADGDAGQRGLILRFQSALRGRHARSSGPERARKTIPELAEAAATTSFFAPVGPQTLDVTAPPTYTSARSLGA